MEKIKILTIYLCLLISLTESQNNKCALKETCGACIRDINCVWCNRPFETDAKTERCGELKLSTNSWCSSQYVVNPQSSGQTVNSIPLQSSTTAGKDAVQISPQAVKLKLRPGQEYELKFKYATAKDYPVDLYYIMDLSSSMAVHKNRLSELGTLLAQTMRTLTKNFRLGFGSFVDKVVEPFVGTYPDVLQNPCFKTRTEYCVPAYSFKNHLSLSEHDQTFRHEVKKAEVSGNIDFPEGGFDALMQAIVCKEEIGWRPKSRHLIVFSSDADFHIAGDGKLGGIVLPNDGKCHMENNEYTHGTKLDYPSIAHIAHTVKEHNINLIFAIAKVSDRVNKTYEDLSRRIEGSTLGILSDDSSNVVEIIKDYYAKIVDGVTMTDNSPSNIDIKYFSSCRGSTEKETNKCDNLTVGAEVDFKAVIKVLKCPDDPNMRKQIFQIKPGALEETLSVEVELLCDCDCEKQGSPRARECHYSGTLQCGICSCDIGKYGANCHCDGSTSTVEDSSSCKISNSSEVCSGLGTCKCNKCDCQQRPNKGEKIYGKFCECTNYSCQRISGALCSNNGVCDCGVCKCFDGYEGDACQCRNRNDTCIASKTGLVCNGHGTCECGYCTCDKSYYGQFCEGCPSCAGFLCDKLKDCVECLVYNTGIYTEEACTSNCSSLDVKIIDKVVDDQVVTEKFCRGMDKEGCIFPFKYIYDEKDKDVVHIFAQKEKNCPSEIYVAGLVGYIIGSILLAGLILLLLWKGVTTVHDRREYAKFDNERKNAKWTRGENPLFKNPTTTFSNPTFNTGNTL